MEKENIGRQEAAVAPAQKTIPGDGTVRGMLTVVPGSDGLIVCPACRARQQANRTFCYKCEIGVVVADRT